MLVAQPERETMGELEGGMRLYRLVYLQTGSVAVGAGLIPPPSLLVEDHDSLAANTRSAARSHIVMGSQPQVGAQSAPTFRLVNRVSSLRQSLPILCLTKGKPVDVKFFL